ncbi:MAG: folate family ECF transporter S component [Ruminococcaceae bacterium]|nr:folate family ECF transporter S component [Oscillospiraceae bacterium]
MKNEVSKKRLRGNLRLLAVSAFLAALSIVCGKYLALSLGNVLRFSFENLPILLSGMMFGPITGALVGVVADVIGCVMVAYPINPLVTLGAACMGLFGGLLFRVTKRLPLLRQTCITVIVTHFVASVIIKTYGLAQYYDMPFHVLMLWRLLNYVIVGVVEWLLLYTVLKNQALRRRFESLRG